MTLPNKSPTDFTVSGTYSATNFNDQINPLYTWGQGEVDAHIAATTGHGATGAVVGTTNTQELSNKTLVAAVFKSDQFVTETNSRVMTLPTHANDNIVTDNSTSTLTNKSITSPTITGAPTAAGATWANLGTVTTADINAGTWQGTIDGNWTAASQTCADLGTVTTADINAGTWQGTIDGNWTAAGQTCADLGTVTTADINAGTWQGTIDGAWTAAGQTCADLGSVSTADINGGTVDATAIGGTTPAAGTFSDGAHYGVPLVFSKTIVLPEYVEDEVTATILPLLMVDATWAPYGIRITKVGMVLDANRAYAIMLEKWSLASPPAAVEDILTGDLDPGASASYASTTSTFTGTGTYYDVAVNNIVGVDLPTTTGAKFVTVWFTYELKAS